MILDKNRVLYPLRSNLGWFQTSNIEQKLLSQIKQSILIYDEIYIEQGTFIQSLMESQDGKISVVLTWCYPFGTDKIPPEIFDSGYMLSQQGIEISIKRVPNSMTDRPLKLNCSILARFKVYYNDILKDIELGDYDFIKFVEFNSDESATHNQEISKLIDSMPKSHFEDIFFRNNLGKAISPDLVMSTFNDMITENLSYDLLYSITLDSTLILDMGHKEFLDGTVPQTKKKKMVLMKPLPFRIFWISRCQTSLNYLLRMYWSFEMIKDGLILDVL